MSEHDIRQLRLMTEKLHKFSDKAIPLSVLITDLEGLLENLDSIDPASKNAFRKQWGVLEDIYADALDRKISGISPSSERQIYDAIAEISKLISDWELRLASAS